MSSGDLTSSGIIEEIRRDLLRRRVRRVLVGLDATAEGHRLLDVAVSLASALESPLTGLFIEDADLLALAELPFSREITLTSGLPRPLESHELEREFRAQAAAMREALAKRAAQHELSWSYDVRRGQRLPSLISEARFHDLVIVSCPPSHLRRANDIRALIQRAADPGGPDVLLVEPPRGPGAEPRSGRRGQVVVLEEGKSAHALAGLVGTRLIGCEEIGLRHMYLRGLEIDRLVRDVRALEGELVVLSTAHRLLREADDFISFISASRCPLLLLQPEESE